MLQTSVIKIKIYNLLLLPLLPHPLYSIGILGVVTGPGLYPISLMAFLVIGP